TFRLYVIARCGCRVEIVPKNLSSFQVTSKHQSDGTNNGPFLPSAPVAQSLVLAIRILQMHVGLFPATDTPEVNCGHQPHPGERGGLIHFLSGRPRKAPKAIGKRMDTKHTRSYNLLPIGARKFGTETGAFCDVEIHQGSNY